MVSMAWLAAAAGGLAASAVVPVGAKVRYASWTRSESEVPVLVVVAVARDAPRPAVDAGYWLYWDGVFAEQEAFFAEASGGSFRAAFDVPHVFTQGPFQTADCAVDSSKCPNLDTADALAAALVQSGSAKYSGMASYQRTVVVYKGGCACLPLGGAAVFGNLAVIGAAEGNPAIPMAIAHELGHTNGARHARNNGREYGNALTVMGNQGAPPSAHFTAAGKASMKWLDVAAQVKTFANGATHPECPPADGGACETSATVWLEAHDAGGPWRPTATYAIRIMTGQPGRPLWVEFRAKYAAELGVDGATLVWAPSSTGLGPNGAEVLSIYGPTELVEPSLARSYLAVGESFVYDLDGTAAKISVLQKSADGQRLQVEVSFLPRTWEKDYAGAPGSRVRGAIACGESMRVQLSGTTKQDVSLYRVFVPQPGTLDLAQLACQVGEGQVHLATLFVYNAYPVQVLEQGDGAFDPAMGAAASFDVRCSGATNTFKLVLSDETSVGGDFHRPMGLDFYLLFVQTEAKPILSSVWIEARCAATGVCRSNFFRQGDSCVQCPAGHRAPVGATSPNQCYRFFESFELSSSRYREYAGRYTRSTATEDGAFVWVRSGPGPVIYLMRSFWGWQLKLEADLVLGFAIPLDDGSNTADHPLAARLAGSDAFTYLALEDVGKNQDNLVDNGFELGDRSWSYTREQAESAQASRAASTSHGRAVAGLAVFSSYLAQRAAI